MIFPTSTSPKYISDFSCSLSLRHRSVGIRKTASYYVLAIAKKIGHRKLLSGTKDLTDKILQATLDCIIDASNDVRYVKSVIRQKSFTCNYFTYVFDEILKDETSQ